MKKHIGIVIVITLAVLAVVLNVWMATRRQESESVVTVAVIPKQDNTFEKRPEEWSIYQYEVGLPNIRHDPYQYQTGGVEGGEYIMGSSAQWSIDYPEDPDSILAFYTNRDWAHQPRFDMSGKTLSVYLRSDTLDLKGAEVYFWVLGNSTRFHYTYYPLKVGVNEWAYNEIPIDANTEWWHLSWAGNGVPESLENILSSSMSYGISIVGFPEGEEPEGSLAMDEFLIQ